MQKGMLALIVPAIQAEGTQFLSSLRAGGLPGSALAPELLAAIGLFRLPPPASVPPLPYRLIQDDGSRDRNIKTSHVAEHWNPDHLVAPFPHEPSQPVTFSSHYKRCWKGEIPLIVGHFRSGVEAHRPDAGFLELTERPGDVHDVGNRDVIDRPGRGFGRRAIE